MYKSDSVADFMLITMFCIIWWIYKAPSDVSKMDAPSIIVVGVFGWMPRNHGNRGDERRMRSLVSPEPYFELFLPGEHVGSKI